MSTGCAEVTCEVDFFKYTDKSYQHKAIAALRDSTKSQTAAMNNWFQDGAFNLYSRN
jgi:hypothetical protein